MKPFQKPVQCRYGAPLGRFDRLTDFASRLHLERVPFIDGDYDQGGAYWGGYPSLPLYCAWNDGANGMQACYTRAKDRQAARAGVLARYPGAKFYR